MASDHDEAAARRKRGGRGFRHMATAATGPLRAAGARRGFAEHRLIANWEEVAGRELAACTAPLKIAFSRDGHGGTLVVAADGARAVEVAHSGDRLVERVNAIYGYRAVDRVKIVQSGHRGFGEDAPGWSRTRRDRADPRPVDATVSPDISAIADSGLRAALARLEANLRERAASRAAGRSRR